MEKITFPFRWLRQFIRWSFMQNSYGFPPNGVKAVKREDAEWEDREGNHRITHGWIAEDGLWYPFRRAHLWKTRCGFEAGYRLANQLTD